MLSAAGRQLITSVRPSRQQWRNVGIMDESSHIRTQVPVFFLWGDTLF